MTEAGRDVTDLVLEFHRAIHELYPHFARLSLTVSSDEWQETCGRLLAVLVLAPARGVSADELEFAPGAYAVWEPLGTAPTELLVAPDPRARLLVSSVVPSTRNPGMVVPFREGLSSEIGGMIRLREFASPVGDEHDVTVLDHAFGYANTRSGLLRVAVPVAQARFYLAGPRD